MKKLKISDLPLVSSLKGLFTIGVDNQNRSVKVSLQFIEDQTTEAVSNADAATKRATFSADAADKSKNEADAATQAANEATALAQASTEAAKEAAENATTAANNASDKAALAGSSAQQATAAAQAAKAATEAAKTATAETVQATEAANEATEETLAKIAVLVPSGLSVECLDRITIGNVMPVRIKAVLSPETAMKNLIYISDNRAVEVSTDGVLTPVSKGRSKVHVIPTMNTALARTLLIEVGEPRLRLSSVTALRFTQAGGFRLT